MSQQHQPKVVHLPAAGLRRRRMSHFVKQLQQREHQIQHQQVVQRQYAVAEVVRSVPASVAGSGSPPAGRRPHQSAAPHRLQIKPISPGNRFRNASGSHSGNADSHRVAERPLVSRAAASASRGSNNSAASGVTSLCNRSDACNCPSSSMISSCVGASSPRSPVGDLPRSRRPYACSVHQRNDRTAPPELKRLTRPDAGSCSRCQIWSR